MIGSSVTKMNWSRIMLRLADARDVTLLRTRLTGLPLREDVILAGSMEWFHDPEPCMIHRSAVMKRLYTEWCDYLEEHVTIPPARIAWSAIPVRLRDMLKCSGQEAWLDIE